MSRPLATTFGARPRPRIPRITRPCGFWGASPLRASISADSMAFARCRPGYSRLRLHDLMTYSCPPGSGQGMGFSMPHAEPPQSGRSCRPTSRARRNELSKVPGCAELVAGSFPALLLGDRHFLDNVQDCGLSSSERPGLVRIARVLSFAWESLRFSRVGARSAAVPPASCDLLSMTWFLTCQ